MNLIVVALFFTCYLSADVAAYAACGVGSWAGTTCVELLQCLTFAKPLELLHRTSIAQHAFFMSFRVRPATCGFKNFMPKVCCPINDSGQSALPPPSVNQDSCGRILWPRTQPDGAQTDLEEFSWLALLEYQTEVGRMFGCGGVLISDRHVLTAAHCLNPSTKLTRVRLGEHNLQTARDCIYDPVSPYCSKSTIDVGIEKQIPHEKYSFLRGPSDFDSLSYDIAVLKLDRSVITDVIKPICLPDPVETRTRTLVVKGKFLSAGWGIKLNNIYPKSFVKLMSRLKEVNKSYCNFKYRQTLHDDIVCAVSKSYTTACVADSGGPLMEFNRNARMTVTGIYSPVDNQPCRKTGVPSTFVDVRQYVDWIRMQMLL